MKRLTSFLAATLMAAAAGAQTLTVFEGSVRTVYPAAETGTMDYDGSNLIVAGKAFADDAVDSILVVSDADAPTGVEVNYSGTSATVTVPGALAPYLEVSVSGAHVSIVAADDLADEITYTLTGTSADGSFTQSGKYKLTLVLDGLTLTSAQGAPLTIDNGKRIAVVLPEGTVSTLADAASGSQKACFYVKGHAELSGQGTLRLTGNARHAYRSDEYTQLKASFGTLLIDGAAADGLHVGQYYEQRGGRVEVSGTAGDGIDVGATNDPTDELNGQLLISGGSVSVSLGATADVKGLKCDSTFTLSGGSVGVTGSGDGVKGIKTGRHLLVNQGSGNATAIDINVSGTTYHKGYTDGTESKTRGIKVDGDFTFDGGTISVSATGKKAKAIAVDGTYHYVSGSINCAVDATYVE